MKNLLYSNGSICAMTCHDWLIENITSGNKYSGSLRPEDLLNIDNSHSKIYRNGFMGDLDDKTLNVTSSPPGCGGCHNFNNTKHSQAPSCLDCNTFLSTSAFSSSEFTQLHDEHSGLSQNICSYCHATGSTETEKARAVCYNCHLSDHMPLAILY